MATHQKSRLPLREMIIQQLFPSSMRLFPLRFPSLPFLQMNSDEDLTPFREHSSPYLLSFSHRSQVLELGPVASLTSVGVNIG